MLPSGTRKGGGTRGMNSPGTPSVAAMVALKRFIVGRARSNADGAISGAPEDARSQNAARRSMRRSGTLPAINAALTAPIDTPVTQSGMTPASASPS